MGKSIAARRPVLDANQKVIAFKIIFRNSFEEKNQLSSKKLYNKYLQAVDFSY